ncbi:hypothetical protein ACFRU3_32590 [Streptomyces sp. NPDC056910]|uniref:hypothetical protein n=1 Tax=Streptomyces sp. NPDC056910 TaxID=3345964 RepID=UPI0036CB9D75
MPEFVALLPQFHSYALSTCSRSVIGHQAPAAKTASLASVASAAPISLRYEE